MAGHTVQVLSLASPLWQMALLKGLSIGKEGHAVITRNKESKYRGPVLAYISSDRDERVLNRHKHFRDPAYGSAEQIIGAANLCDVRLLNDLEMDQYFWKLNNVQDEASARKVRGKRNECIWQHGRYAYFFDEILYFGMEGGIPFTLPAGEVLPITEIGVDKLPYKIFRKLPDWFYDFYKNKDSASA